MKTITLKNILSLIFFATVLSSCEKEISLDLNPSEPRIVIEGVIKDGEYAQVRITKSKNYEDQDSYPPVTNAKVVLTNGQGDSDTLKFNSSEKLYRSEFIKGEQGTNYYLTIDVQDKIYTSESKMPYLVNIDSIYLYKMVADRYYPMVVIQDRPNEENFYRFIVHHNDVKMPTILVMNDEDRDGRKIERILPFSREDDEKVDIYEGDHFLIEMQCITEPIFDFYNAWAMISSNQANPPSNIKGGALGFFTTYSYTARELIVKKENLK